MIYLLFNPLSNNKKSIETLEKVKTTLKDGEYKEVNLVELTDYESIVKELTPEDSIYLLGGDGTLNRFINYIKDMKVPNDIYFYSAGTGNDFWHDVDEEGRCERIKLNEYIQSLPTVKIYDKELLFINGIGFGIDGYCCEEGDRLQAKSDKPVNYTSIAIKGLLYKFKPRNAKVTVDGVSKEYRKVWLAPTMIGRYYGGGMKVTPDQDRLNKEHLVTSAVMYGKGKLITLMRFPKIFTGEHVQFTDMVDIKKGHEVTVEFDRPCALQVDGETYLNVTKYTVIYK